MAGAVAATERAQRALLQNQKLEALGRLTGGIAHEFNNLLQTLTAALQLAKLVSSQDRVQSLIDTCNRAVERAAVLTRQLASFGRAQEARMESVDLSAQIKGLEHLLRSTLPSGVILEIRLPAGLWPVNVDPSQLELALVNLAMNAKDAMPADGTLTIETQNETLDGNLAGLPAGDYVRLRVADTGCGMAPHVLEKALDPFFTTKTVGTGAGLGLPQAYGFARQSEGALVLQSTEGVGTIVDIHLPRGTTPAAVSGPSVYNAQGTAAGGIVLFVEDDALVRAAVVPALESAGFTILVAATADEALHMLENGAQADVVLSDIVMPGKTSGIDLAHAVRERFPRMKVVLATGYSERSIAIADVEILAKPYNITDAVQALHAAISAGS